MNSSVKLLAILICLVSSCGGPQSRGGGIDLNTSSCLVGEDAVLFNVVIPTVIEQLGREYSERIAWNVTCFGYDFPRCTGNGLTLSGIEEDGEITGDEAFTVNGAEVVSIDGLHAVVRYGDSEFRIDAENGTIAHEGAMRAYSNVSGEAACDEYGAPQTGSSTDE